MKCIAPSLFAPTAYVARDLKTWRDRGGKVEATISMGLIMMNRLTVTGSTLRARTPEEKRDIGAAISQRIWPLVGEGVIKPRIYASLPLEQAAKAHRLLTTGEHIGKVVLVVGTVDSGKSGPI